jgi:hypothetical protein
MQAVQRERDRNARGGVLVKGQFDYVCVVAARCDSMYWRTYSLAGFVCCPMLARSSSPDTANA